MTIADNKLNDDHDVRAVVALETGFGDDNNNNFESKTSDNDPMLNTDLNRTPHKLYVGTSGGGVIIAKF